MPTLVAQTHIGFVKKKMILLVEKELSMGRATAKEEIHRGLGKRWETAHNWAGGSPLRRYWPFSPVATATQMVLSPAAPPGRAGTNLASFLQ